MLASYLFAIAAVVVAGKLLLPLAEKAGFGSGNSVCRIFLGIDWYVGYDLDHWAFPVSVDFKFKYVELRVLFFNVGFNAWRF